MSDPTNPSLPGDPQQPPPPPVSAPPVSASGNSVPSYPPPVSSYDQPSKTLSIVGMVLGIAGLVLAPLWGGGIPFSIAAVVLGFMGRNREPAARGFWLTALITGFVGIAIGLVTVILFIVFFGALVATIPAYQYRY